MPSFICGIIIVSFPRILVCQADYFLIQPCSIQYCFSTRELSQPEAYIPENILKRNLDFNSVFGASTLPILSASFFHISYSIKSKYTLLDAIQALLTASKLLSPSQIKVFIYNYGRTP